ncbi:MAG: hypothetical protein QM681_12445 [Novosphingobium sp.]
MAKRPLKVFRTSIGFDDAYVAATSRKAALQAWGAGMDLFASGAAETVTDPGLSKAPLAQPGVVIRVARGSRAEHLAALTQRPKRAVKTVPAPAEDRGVPARTKRKTPRPSRANLTRAEAAVKRASDRAAAAIAGIDARIEQLRRERDALRAKRDEQLRKLEARRERAEEDYRRAMDDWEG